MSFAQYTRVRRCELSKHTNERVAGRWFMSKNTHQIFILLFLTVIIAFATKPIFANSCDQAMARLSFPAYSRDSDVSFKYQGKGLSISLVHGPGVEHWRPGVTKSFDLRYEPSKFWSGSLMRRVFGRKPLNYTLQDIRQISTSYFTGAEGEVLAVYLSHPLDLDRTLPEGPLMMIDRENGQVILYPAGTDVDQFSLGDFVRGLWTETQQKIWPFYGVWTKVGGAPSALKLAAHNLH